MITPENKIINEIHGCIVCANLFNVLAVYTLDGKLLDCTVTSPGGHIVQNDKRLLVACDTHTAEEIEPAHKRVLSTSSKEIDDEQGDE
ncbi:MAG: hypothetical protein H6635_08115 [Anaerolineales bacterium]|nr:hypothetical protein [Anaerolineales bacterium]MCB9145319.1 hypothetical protein [Anaerolineales bacterium]